MACRAKVMRAASRKNSGVGANAGKQKRPRAYGSKTAKSVSVWAGEAEPKPLRPSQCSSYMRAELARELPEIVRGLVEAAKSGSFQHLKLVTEFLDLRPDAKQPRARKGPIAKLWEEIEREHPR